MKIKIIFTVLIIAAVTVALTKYLDGKAVEKIISDADWKYLGYGVAITAAYLIGKIVKFQVLSAAVAPLTFIEASRIFMASQAPAALPGGAVFRVMLLHKEKDVELAAVTPIILFMSAIDMVVLVVAAVIGALYFGRQQTYVIAIAVTLFITSMLLYIRATRQIILKWLSGLARLKGLQDKLAVFVKSASSTVTPGKTAAGLTLAAVTFVLDIMVLWMVTRAFAVYVPVTILILVTAFPSILGRLSALPLGIGITDATMAGALDLLPSVTLETAVVVVVTYRIIRYLMPVLAGASVYFLVWLPTYGKTPKSEGEG